MERLDIVFREGRPPTICVLTGALGWSGGTERPPPTVIRDREGKWTDAFLKIKQGMQLEP